MKEESVKKIKCSKVTDENYSDGYRNREMNRKTRTGCGPARIFRLG